MQMPTGQNGKCMVCRVQVVGIPWMGIVVNHAQLASFGMLLKVPVRHVTKDSTSFLRHVPHAHTEPIQLP